MSSLGKPVIQFNVKEHAFGSLKQKTQANWIFNFKNAGNTTLVIEKIQSG